MPARLATTLLHPLQFLARRRTLRVRVTVQLGPLYPVVKPVRKLRMTMQLVLMARVELVPPAREMIG